VSFKIIMTIVWQDRVSQHIRPARPRPQRQDQDRFFGFRPVLYQDWRSPSTSLVRCVWGVGLWKR